MKLAFFDDYVLGVVQDGWIYDVSEVTAEIPRLRPQDLLVGLMDSFDRWRGKLADAVGARNGRPLSEVTLRPPVPKPGNIVCMAVNYMENGTRMDLPEINAFMKSTNVLTGDNGIMVLPDVAATVFEGEAEIAAVIGRRCTRIAEDEAMDHIFGYTNFIDGSARGLTPFYQMKARDGFTAIGPWITTADEIADPQSRSVRLWNNGRLMQDYNTSDMAHNIERSIAWVSSVHTLDVGDIVAFGTNHLGLHPFQDGDNIEMEVDGLGRLQVRVRDELCRTWPRETRQERLLRGEAGPSRQSGGKFSPRQADGQR